MMSTDISIIGVGPSRHDVTTIGGLLNGTREIITASAKASLPFYFARRIQLHYPGIRSMISITVIPFVPSDDIAIVGMGPSRHNVTAIGGLLNKRSQIIIPSPEASLPLNCGLGGNHRRTQKTHKGKRTQHFRPHKNPLVFSPLSDVFSPERFIPLPSKIM
jgi:hypothetical protein